MTGDQLRRLLDDLDDAVLDAQAAADDADGLPEAKLVPVALAVRKCIDLL
jgi:hypothetical protein